MPNLARCAPKWYSMVYGAQVLELGGRPPGWTAPSARAGDLQLLRGPGRPAPSPLSCRPPPAQRRGELRPLPRRSERPGGAEPGQDLMREGTAAAPSAPPPVRAEPGSAPSRTSKSRPGREARDVKAVRRSCGHAFRGLLRRACLRLASRQRPRWPSAGRCCTAAWPVPPPGLVRSPSAAFGLGRSRGFRISAQIRNGRANRPRRRLFRWGRRLPPLRSGCPSQDLRGSSLASRARPRTRGGEHHRGSVFPGGQ